MEDEANKRIPIEDADLPTLKHFAELALGLEVKPGTNAHSLRGKIKTAMPDIKDVPPIPKAPEPVVQMPQQEPMHVQAPFVPDPAAPIVDGENPAARPAAVSRPASAALMHPNQDPKVTLKIHKTDDKRRSKDVTVGVNGVVWRMKRGEVINVPYRVYLALQNAKEKAAVELDEINPLTGTPKMGWEEIHSYPFEVHKMPSDEEIAAWEVATGSGFAASPAVAAAA